MRNARIAEMVWKHEHFEGYGSMRKRVWFYAEKGMVLCGKGYGSMRKRYVSKDIR